MCLLYVHASVSIIPLMDLRCTQLQGEQDWTLVYMLLGLITWQVITHFLVLPLCSVAIAEVFECLVKDIESSNIPWSHVVGFGLTLPW